LAAYFSIDEWHSPQDGSTAVNWSFHSIYPLLVQRSPDTFFEQFYTTDLAEE
jgi:hypothetical protein